MPNIKRPRGTMLKNAIDRRVIEVGREASYHYRAAKNKIIEDLMVKVKDAVWPLAVSAGLEVTQDGNRIKLGGEIDGYEIEVYLAPVRAEIGLNLQSGIVSEVRQGDIRKILFNPKE